MLREQFLYCEGGGNLTESVHEGCSEKDGSEAEKQRLIE